MTGNITPKSLSTNYDAAIETHTSEPLVGVVSVRNDSYQKNCCYIMQVLIGQQKCEAIVKAQYSDNPNSNSNHAKLNIGGIKSKNSKAQVKLNSNDKLFFQNMSRFIMRAMLGNYIYDIETYYITTDEFFYECLCSD